MCTIFNGFASEYGIRRFPNMNVPLESQTETKLSDSQTRDDFRPEISESERFPDFTRRVKTAKQTKFRLSDFQPYFLKKAAPFRGKSVSGCELSETAGRPD
jgi:hypothetical protein